jgi:hypothetical protein
MKGRRARELGVVVFWVVGVLGGLRGEAEGVGGEVVVGGAGWKGFNEPESGGAGLGLYVANQGDADGVFAFSESAERSLKFVAEDGEEGLEEIVLGFRDGVFFTGGALELFDRLEVVTGKAAQAGRRLAVVFGIGEFERGGFPGLQGVLEVAAEKLGEVVLRIVFAVVGEAVKHFEG